MNPFISPATTGKNSFGLYLAVFVIVLIANFAGSIPGAWALFTWKANPDQLPAYLVTGLMLLGFVASLVALWCLMKPIHARDPKTLIRHDGVVSFRRIVVSGGVWLACTAVVECVTYIIKPDYYHYTFRVSDWVPAFVIGLILIPPQSWFEELFFRGYLLQGIGRLNSWVGVLVTSVIFGLAHSMNDEVEAVGSLGIAMIYYIGFGLVMAAITLYDKSLELPLGIHAANNIYAFLIVGYPSSSLPSASIFETRTLNFPLMTTQWVIVVLLYVLTMKYGLRYFETSDSKSTT